jgi:alpha-tubulin suppressor-like RCC1 family protein
MITRRSALALISAAPLAVRAAMQTPARRERRAQCFGYFTYVLETDGRVTFSLLEGLGFDHRHSGLGGSDPIPFNVAFDLPAVRQAVDVVRGGSASLALMPDGRILAWGINARGGLGITPLEEFEKTGIARRTPEAPTPVLDITDAVGVAGGGDHSLAVTRSGAVYAWGYNIAGQLGLGGMPDIKFWTGSQAPWVVPYPVRIAGLSDVVAVAAGGAHSLALLKDGTVRAWGENRWGQLGDGTTVRRNAPVAVTGVAGATAIVAGSQISGALLADGTVMAWGHGNGGLGRKSFKQDAPYPTPARVDGVSGIRALACGESHMLAITNAGTVVSWGTNLVGEVGHRRMVPTPLPALKGVRYVSAAVARSVATLADGTIMVWGKVPKANTSEPIPLVISGLKNPL